MVAIAAAAAGAFFGAKAIKKSFASPPAKTPEPVEPPTIQDAEADADEQVKRRRRISLLSGGQTDLTRGSALVSDTDVQKKQLVGV